MDKQKSIYDLKLHENLWIDECNNVQRVPGGWIYNVIYFVNDSPHGFSSVFVAHHNDMSGAKNG